jgi:ribosomal protein S18 acetylase RimI-like enzyme
MSITEQRTTARLAQIDDRRDVVETLTAAFFDDPVFTWMLPDAALRRAMIPGWFDVWAEGFARHDETYVVGDRAVSGTALWAPPGVAPMSPEDEAALEAGFAALPEDAIERIVTCVSMFEATHPDEPNWYLNFLAVDPAHQGQGHGSTLLRQVLDVADERGEPAYLDATTPRNRALYERHGFRVIADHVLPNGPTAYAMWREPQR